MCPIDLPTGKIPSVPAPSPTAKSVHTDFGMIASRVRGSPKLTMVEKIGTHRRSTTCKSSIRTALKWRAFRRGTPESGDFEMHRVTRNEATPRFSGVASVNLGDTGFEPVTSTV